MKRSQIAKRSRKVGEKPPVTKRTRQTKQPAEKPPSNSNSGLIGVCSNVSERYAKVGRVGQGTYGVVYKAKDRLGTRGFVALKRCIPHNESSDGFPLTTLREIHALRICAPHPNVVKLHHVAVSNDRNSVGGTFLVFEYCSHDLAQIIDRHYMRTKTSPFQPAQIKTLLQQLLSAVQFCHDRCILHRDIKMSNLLYSGALKLADFGLARQWSKSADWLLTPNVVSLWYRPPELLLQRHAQRYTSAIDMWAVGCIFAELMEGFPLLDGKDEEDQARKIIKYLGHPPTALARSIFPLRRPLPSEEIRHDGGQHALLDRFCDLTVEGLSLLTQLIHYDHSTRWTAQQALASSYFDEQPTPAVIMPTFT